MPSMSTDGWVTDSVQIADYLMSHFFLSEFSQTALYPKQVSSLPYLIEIYKKSPKATADAIQKTLVIYFSRYFNNVVVQCQNRDDPSDDRKAIVDIFIEYVDSDGKLYSFAKAAEMIEGKFNKIVEINNILGEG